jgi:hypothetical protein
VGRELAVVKSLAWLPGAVGMMLAGAVTCGPASAAPVSFAFPPELQQDDASRLIEMSGRPAPVVAIIDNAVVRAAAHRDPAPVEAHLGLAPLASASSASVGADVTDETAPASASFVTSLLTENSQPGVLSLIAMGAVLCRLGARVMRIRR